MKTVVKRPKLHYLIIIFYFAAPVFNILLLNIFAKVSVAEAIDKLFAAYGTLAAIWLLSAPIVGIGLIWVHKVSWYVFLGHSSLIIADYVYKWVSHGQHYWTTIDIFYNIAIFLGNLLLVATMGYIIQKDFRAPYFQALRRHFREHTRIPIHHTILLDNELQEIDDLSEAGCSVPGDFAQRSPGEVLVVQLDAENLSIACNGTIMRVSAAGIGIKFDGIKRAQRREIRTFLKRRFSLRNRVDLDSHWENGASFSGKLADISSGGCYMEADPSEVSIGLHGQVTIKVSGHSYTVPGQVAWLNPEGLHKKPVGFGISFPKKHTRIVKEVERIKGKLDLTR